MTHKFLIWLLKLFTLLLVIRGYCFSALISHEIIYKNNQNVGNLLMFFVKSWGSQNICGLYRYVPL